MRKLISVSLGFLYLALFVSACVVSGGPPAPSTQAGPTYFLTQYVTQIVATAPTSTLQPTSTSTPWPTPTLEWDPFAAPVTFPRVGCAGSRLSVGAMAFVAWVDARTRLYSTADTLDDPGMRNLVVGEKLQVIDGPSCAYVNNNRQLMWKVYMLADKLTGFAMEGDGNTYWILPLSPKEPTPNIDD